MACHLLGTNYLNQCWFVVNLIFRNKLGWNLKQNRNTFIYKMHMKMPEERWPFCSGLNVLSVFYRVRLLNWLNITVTGYILVQNVNWNWHYWYRLPFLSEEFRMERVQVMSLPRWVIFFWLVLETLKCNKTSDGQFTCQSFFSRYGCIMFSTGN